jgi:hypothetical protein
VQQFIADIAARPDDEVRPLDSHPSTARRLTVLRDLPATNIRPDSRPAVVLLNPDVVADLYRPEGRRAGDREQRG